MTRSTKISRRSLLALMCSTAFTGTIGWPKSARAMGVAIPYAPPPLMTKDSGVYFKAYRKSLISFINTIEDSKTNPTNRYYPYHERLLDMSITLEDAEAVSEVYAISSLIRDYPFSRSLGQTPFFLRSPAYQDMSNPVSLAPNVGPTMEFVRGQKTSVWMVNNLEVCGATAVTPDTPITKESIGHTPHNFNWTNLHTHGLHIEPNAPSDDVLVTIQPSSAAPNAHPNSAHGLAITAENPSTFPYYYDLPADHPVGTFWYHPHMHGAVASQVGPGMAGALLTRSQEGQTDFDEILENECGIIKATQSNPGDERVVVLQSFQYNAVSGDGVDGVYSAANYYNSSPVAPTAANCHVNSAADMAVTTAPISVNGSVNPMMTMRPGEILRLRMVNATNGETFLPRFKAVDPSTGEPISGAAMPAVYAIAVDGITLLPVLAGAGEIDLPIDISDASVEENAKNFSDDTPYFLIDYTLENTSEKRALYWTTAEILTLAAAQRLDILVQMPPSAEGIYQLYGAATADVPNVATNGKSSTDNILRINVSGSPRVEQEIPTMSMFDNASNKANKRGMIQRPPLAPAGRNVAIDAIKSQWFGFINDKNIPDVPAGHKAQTGNFQINGTSFDANLEDLGQVQLTKDALTAWELYSVDGPHIFHIHINSFAVHGRYYAEWSEVSDTPGWPITQLIGTSKVTGWPFLSDNSTPTPTFKAPYLMPIWRDTLYFDSMGKNPSSNGENYGVTGLRALTTSYQKDFTGEFVLHCHKLFHEDSGMMLTVQITA